MARGIGTFVSASTVQRWLNQDALKPWQCHSWIFITDPDFQPKAERVLDGRGGSAGPGCRVTGGNSPGPGGSRGLLQAQGSRSTAGQSMRTQLRIRRARL